MAFLLGIPAMIAGVLGNITLMQWMSGVAIFLAWFYYYMTKDYGKWEKKGFPSVAPSFMFGNNKKMVLAQENFWTLHFNLYNALKDKGGIGIYYDGSESVIYVTDPALMTKIQITDFDHFYDHGFFPSYLNDREENAIGLASSKGQEWKKFKAAVTPAFRLKHMKNISAHLNNCAGKLVNHIKPSAKSGELVDFTEVCGLFTLDCIASSVLSLSIDPYADPNSEWIKMGKGLLQEWRFMLASFMPRLMATFSISMWGPKSAKFFVKLAADAIKERSKMANPPQDILGILLKARNNQLEGEDTANLEITDKMIAETIMQFFMDGHTTVALFLQFACYFLACNPDIQERAYQEVEEMNGKYGSDINKDNVDELVYLDNVLSETGRLSPFPISARLVTKPWKVPGKDVVLPVNTRVLMGFGGCQVDEKYFPDPFTFDPDRFLPENKKNIVPGSYQPWGQGPRQCIGIQIARMESKVMLFNLLKNFRLEKGPKTVYPLKWATSGFMDNVGGVTLKVVPR